MERFEEIRDAVVIDMTIEERQFLLRLANAPTDDFACLVEFLHREGCEFPRQQAALILRNSPGQAADLLVAARAAVRLGVGAED
jgi:hypothetical protein